MISQIAYHIAESSTKIHVSDDLSCVVFCEGHGPKGALFANAVSEFQMHSLLEHPTHIFTQTEEFLSDNLGKDVVQDGVSGTTCSYLRIEPIRNLLICANVGTSMVRAWEEPGEGVVLTTHHTVESEYNRIVRAGGKGIFYDPTGTYAKGKHRIYVNNVVQTQNAYKRNCRGESATCVLSGDNLPLCLSRCFGSWDFPPVGVRSLPSVYKHSSKQVQAIVMGSTAFWDCMQFRRVGDILLSPEFRNAQEAVEALHKESGHSVLVLYLS